MAFSATVTEVVALPGGLVMERGTWDGDSVTTGTITAVDGTTDYGAGKVAITKVLDSDFSSDGDTEVYKAYDAGDNKVKITFQSGDTGTYQIIGKAH